MPLFVIFVQPLITSCQIRHLRKICQCPKNQQSTSPFLSSHLNIWPNPWWIFGTLVLFVKIFLLSILPSLSPHFKFCQIVDGFLLNSPFSQICHFCESRKLPNTDSGGNFWARRTVITYEAVCLPENAHGYDGWGDVQAIMSHNGLLRLCNKAPESIAHVLAGQSCS